MVSSIGYSGQLLINGVKYFKNIKIKEIQQFAKGYTNPVRVTTRMIWSNIFALTKSLSGLALLKYALCPLSPASLFFFFFICSLISVAHIGLSVCPRRHKNLDDLQGVYEHCPFRVLGRSTEEILLLLDKVSKNQACLSGEFSVILFSPGVFQSKFLFQEFVRNFSSVLKNDSLM